MNTPACVRSGVGDRNAGERWVPQVGLDCEGTGDLRRDSYTEHKHTQTKTFLSLFDQLQMLSTPPFET